MPAMTAPAAKRFARSEVDILSTSPQVFRGSIFMAQLEFDFEGEERRSVPELWTPDEIFDRVDAGSLPSFYEDQRLERKPAGFHAEALAIYVCMWANTPPAGGLIALGVEDDGSVSGCHEKGEYVVKTERQIRNDLVPDAVFTTKRLQVTNASGKPDFVLLYRVQYREDKVVETNKGEAYIRRTDTKHLLNDDEKRELQRERGQSSFELEPCSLSWSLSG